MNVADWLHNLGMGRYTAAFHAHGITAEVLPCLTADDLNDVGVASIGHRRVFLRAIAAMRAAAPIDEPSQAQRKDRRVERALTSDRRATSAQCHVLRPGGLHSTVGPPRSRRSQHHNSGLSEPCNDGRGAIWRLRGSLRRGWSAGLFRMACGTRVKCRAGCSCCPGCNRGCR